MARLLTVGLVPLLSASAAVNVYLTGTPDYEWHLACFGTATGNLMGYWDRHGFPNFYTGPTGGGLAPLDSFGANRGIRSLWASAAGLDGRPANRPGHEDDYYVAYESTDPDPYVTAHRAEHEPDCIGDFTGMNQNKWTNLNGECDGNLDGWSFVYWDATGNRRVNFTPGPAAGLPAIDMQSGLRSWTKWRGYDAAVFTQLADINPDTPSGKGFTFADLKAEIDAGYPVLLFIQSYPEKSRSLTNMVPMTKANPEIHGIVAYGYYEPDGGTPSVHLRTSWASGDYVYWPWMESDWLDLGWTGFHMTLRGVISYHPLPRIMEVKRANGQLTLRWHGPASELYDAENDVLTQLHWYVVEKATSLTAGGFTPVAPSTTEHELTLPEPSGQTVFLRVKLVPPGSGGQ
jgi:hypothetical protein